MTINLGLGLRGPDVRPGLEVLTIDIIESHKGDERSLNVMKGQGRPRKVMVGLFPSLD